VLKVDFLRLFTAKIEVVKCPKDPREWKQVFEIYPVGINETVLVDLEMMCQCDCEKPGNPVSWFFTFLHRIRVNKTEICLFSPYPRVTWLFQV
jgi:hypothetical protein